MPATEFLEALRPRSEVELAVQRSGRWTTRPVWFAIDGATVYLLPMYGTDTKWYKYVTVSPEIELSVEGKRVRAQARVLLDAEHLADVAKRFRSKYGDLERYYRKIDVAVAVTI